jgi:hypothetical protein
VVEFDWTAIDAANEQRHKAELAQQWEEQVMAVAPERRVYIGKIDAWRYLFIHKDHIVSVPLHEHPETGGNMAILPEDYGKASEWAIAFITPLSEFPGRGL